MSSQNRVSKLLAHLTPVTTLNSTTTGKNLVFSDVFSQWESMINVSQQPSNWLLITQDIIDEFSNLTRDHNWIHKSTAKDKGSPFGDAIAHGLLLLSFTPYFGYELAAKNTKQLPVNNLRNVVNYGYDKVRFINPVLVNSEIRMKNKIIKVSKGKRKNNMRVVVESSIECRRNGNTSKIAVIIESVVLYQFLK